MSNEDLIDELGNVKLNSYGILRRMEGHERQVDTSKAQFGAVSPTAQQEAAIQGVKTWLQLDKLYLPDAMRGLAFSAEPPEVRAPHWRTTIKRQFYIIGGVAGAGKTLTLGILAHELVGRLRVAFCAPTGRASGVLARSLRAGGVEPLYCGTIHRLIYTPRINPHTGEVQGWVLRTDLNDEYDLVVIDEASMVGSELLDDLVTCDVPILAVGDHKQLPPVGEDVQLMANPDIRLEEVHRQALDNPVIAFATAVREGRDWRGMVQASKDPRLQAASLLDATGLVMDRFYGKLDRPLGEDPLVICGKNKTRVMLNKAARTGLGPDPVVGDRLICLRNTYMQGMLLANGFRGLVSKLLPGGRKHQVKVNARFPEEGLVLEDGKLCKAQFGAEKVLGKFTDVPGCRSWEDTGILMDFGYAITTHKAQGSQADEVLLLVEDFQGSQEDFRRWLYTGATRSVSKLTVMY